jgi:lipoprotein-anchoring transpeptidase ErfK/SrfK
MRYLVRTAAALAASFTMVGAAYANVVVTIDKSQQTMSVAVDGATRYSWPVSTARAGYSTPNGVYHPQMMARSWFSRKYYNSPMPHSIFFHGGYAIHGSYEISRLGGPASHGCVRLHPSHAATLFALVKSEGTSHTRIVVTGSTPHVARARYRHSDMGVTPGYSTYGNPYPYGGYGGAQPGTDRSMNWWLNR